MRLTEHQVEQIIGQTPCLCGAIDTWHARCYRGKTTEQIKAEYKIAYAKARRKIRAMTMERTKAIIQVAAHD